MFSGEATKFFCPKCKSFYESNQRFCPKDGARLLPGIESSDRIQNVFSKVLTKKNYEKSERIEPWQPEDPDSILEIEEIEKKPATRLINPFKIPSGTIEPNEKKELFNPEKPRMLIGKTLKGRYQITNFIKQNPKNFVYLADDLITNKKVLVYIFYNEDFSDKVLAEERVSLSHTKHPNIAATIDSGLLQEGNPFLVIEKPQGETLEEKIEEKGHLDSTRIAKIVRQVAEALNEAHRNGILHRNLTPKNIFLTRNEKGAEIVKVTEFAVAEGDNIVYLSPEQLEGKPATALSDVFSLGIISYELLTKQLPFQGASSKEILEAQRKGMKVKPSNLRLDISSSTDAVIEKAISYEPSQRYLMARDFGEAFYNSITKPNSSENSQIPKPSNIVISAKNVASKSEPPKINKVQKTEKRNPVLKSILLAVLLATFLIALGAYLFFTGSKPQPEIQTEIVNPTTQISLTPPNTLYFRNTGENLTGSLAENYRDFSFFYPSDWKIYPSKGVFVDVAKKDKNNIPIEQFLVTFYKSLGSFEDDMKLFPKLIKQTNQKLKAQLPNYRFLSESSIEISQQRAYQMRFEAFDTRKNIKIFGKRVFIPAEDNKTTGLVLTMLATSLSDIASSEDVGKRGGLKIVLETFKTNP
ncbi:MAG: serine/threonine protein kinase [Pyrinomonadaceae bacterium]|nr:serine/threonine protein kinase [Pyrinomonadaceae bacterium]MCX7640053.1 serine/threonine protein kinase [Pyrinomonadaceae bacterium]MDW8304225.1 serine/threonine-protein kinase [Acidobacteriota bacterium]